jgi:Uma2 family endonuclease
MTTPAAIRFTYRDYLQLPEESRYEILEGDLQMSPSPSARHQQAVGSLFDILLRICKSRDLGRIFVAPFDVILSETDVVQPDILFVSKARTALIQERGVFGAPDLVVEVLSPATAERDRTVKAKLYARAGVKELWLADPEEKSIEILELGADGFRRRQLARAGETAASGIVPDFRADVAAVFE